MLRLTRVSHDPPWQHLVAAATTEDLATDSTVMTSTERVEAIATLIALTTVVVWHPVLLEVTVLICLGCLSHQSRSLIQIVSFFRTLSPRPFYADSGHCI